METPPWGSPQKRPCNDTSKPAMWAGPRQGVLAVLGGLAQVGRFGAPASRPALEDVTMVEDAVEHGRDRGGVCEDPAPVLDGAVGGEDRGAALVAAHDQFEEVLGGGGGKLAHAEVVDDEQRDAGELRELLLALAGEGGIGKLLA